MINKIIKKFKNKFTFNGHKRLKAFSLIEAIVSTALITLALLGPITLALNAVKTINVSRDRLIATYLADDIFERFRNYRDHFTLACNTVDIIGDYSGLKCIQGGNDYDLTSLNNSLIDYRSGKIGPQGLAWSLFLDKLGNNKNGSEIYLDNTSFSTTTVFTDKTSGCEYLYLKDNEYSCDSSGDATNFSRKVYLYNNIQDSTNNNEEIDKNTLKIKVVVEYTNPNVFLVNPKKITVVQYIYRR